MRQSFNKFLKNQQTFTLIKSKDWRIQFLNNQWLSVLLKLKFVFLCTNQEQAWYSHKLLQVRNNLSLQYPSGEHFNWQVWGGRRSPDVPFDSGDDNLLFCQVVFDQSHYQRDKEEGVENSQQEEDLDADPELEERQEEQNR